MEKKEKLMSFILNDLSKITVLASNVTEWKDFFAIENPERVSGNCLKLFDELIELTKSGSHNKTLKDFSCTIFKSNILLITYNTH